MEFENLKKPEIIDKLVELGIEHNKADKKEVLLNLLKENFEEGEDLKVEAETEVEVTDVDTEETETTETETETETESTETVDVEKAETKTEGKVKASFVGKSGRVFPLGVFENRGLAQRAYSRKGGKKLIIEPLE